jgi:DNA-binding response OmpR family regulator
VIEGKQVALTTPQYELLAMLAARMLAEGGKPDEERGFVPMADLMKLSLDVPDPGEDHVRQLVRRVRKALLKADIGDLIEARRGVGYRLRVIPA